MITQKPAASRLPLKAASSAFAALLALGLPLAAQSRGHASGGGGDRSAHSTGGGSHSSSPGGAPHYSGGNSSGGNSSGGSHSGGNSGGGRTAHEVPGGSSSSSAQRQPSNHGGDGHGHGGGHGGYYGYGYPYGYYGGWGFWPGISWGYGDPYYGGYGGYGYPYEHGYPGAAGRYYDSYQRGALDLDVAPGRTHVFVDGEDLGPVDRYDGWPGYLWLPKGTYDVAFYLDGYKTIARQLTVYPGTVIDVDDRMEQGQSVRPQDLATKTHERRDERLSYERQRRDRLGHPYGDDDDNQDWRDRARRDRDHSAMRHDNDNDDDDDQNGRMEEHSSGSGAHLRLSVEPEDASVYLDGQFVGTGNDISLLQAGLPVAPGTHRLAVVRPGHKAIEKEFDVKAGGDVELDIELESGSGR
jgi:hypothetical protein